MHTVYWHSLPGGKKSTSRLPILALGRSDSMALYTDGSMMTEEEYLEQQMQQEQQMQVQAQGQQQRQQKKGQPARGRDDVNFVVPLDLFSL